jgi:hypothetical protein
VRMSKKMIGQNLKYQYREESNTIRDLSRKFPAKDYAVKVLGISSDGIQDFSALVSRVSEVGERLQRT